MRAGEASITAQRVAAHRLGFERAPAPGGDAAAEERLARDVAGSIAVHPDGPMVRYLRARTTFFDRAVVRALDAGMRQVVITAAGYDGRALRYARPGVVWFEVDHPDTQRDKRERLSRLGINAPHIRFVAADFARHPVDAALFAAGLDGAVPSLFLCEGVAVYLEHHVLEALLRGVRAAAAPGSRLAISLSMSFAPGDRGGAARREAFQARVARVGEPARTSVTAEQAGELFAASGWRAVTPTGSRASATTQAGLVVAEPV